MEAPRFTRGAFFLSAIGKSYSSGATGGIDSPCGLPGAAGTVFTGAFGARALCAAAFCDCTASTEPAVSCGAAAGRLRGSGGTAADFTGFVCHPVRFREQIRIEQSDEVGEAIIVAMMRCRGQQHHVIGLGGQLLCKLVAFCFFGLVPTR